ncbi:MAG: serine/threonine-protein kinase [Pseudomonadota bacterium]
MSESRENKYYYCPSCRCAAEDFDQYCPGCDTGRPPLGWPEDLYIGRTVGSKYKIEKRVSSGGFGVIFLAAHRHGHVEIGKVIIKMLHPEHCFEATVKKRFINEAKAARKIASPHVVKVFDLDFDKGMVPYMVQEYVEGETLADILSREGKLDLPRAVNIAIQIADGMKEAHDKGILHRDLKPENIIIQQSGTSDFVKVIDFGIARIETAATMATASFIGTPRYMSPEQIQGIQLDRRSDIFSLGVILFEAATGHPPIEANGSELEYLNLNLSRRPKKMIDVDPSVPEGFSMFVSLLLEKDRDKRPPDMDTVITELAKIAEISGWKADHTGAYRIKEDGTVTGPSIHQAPTEHFQRRTPPPEKSRLNAATLLIAGGVATLVLSLVVAAVLLLSGPGGNTAPADKPDKAEAVRDMGRETFPDPPPPSVPPEKTEAQPAEKAAAAQEAQEPEETVAAEEEETPGEDEPAEKPEKPKMKKKKAKKKKTPWTKI